MNGSVKAGFKYSDRLIQQNNNNADPNTPETTPTTHKARLTITLDFDYLSKYFKIVSLYRNTPVVQLLLRPIHCVP